VRVRNRFQCGDRLEALHPAGNRIFVLQRMENATGQALQIAPGNGHHAWLPLPEESVGAFLVLILK
jgi:putative protease